MAESGHGGGHEIEIDIRSCESGGGGHVVESRPAGWAGGVCVCGEERVEEVDRGTCDLMEVLGVGEVGSGTDSDREKDGIGSEVVRGEWGSWIFDTNPYPPAVVSWRRIPLFSFPGFCDSGDGPHCQAAEGPLTRI